MSAFMTEYGPLMVFSAIMLFGIVVASPAGVNLFKEMARTKRMLTGAFIIAIGGLAASQWTTIIHNQIVATGATEFCASDGLVQCGSVIGDPVYSVMPVIGIAWGTVGLLAFGTLGFMIWAIRSGSEEGWAKGWVDYAWYLAVAGLPGVVWLVVVELFLVDGAPHICPYCTSVHIAVVAIFAILHIVRKDKDAGTWEF